MAFERVVNQKDGRGCIPACAITVLRKLGYHSAREEDLLGTMTTSTGSDFERLGAAIGRWTPCTLEVREDGPTFDDLRKVANGGLWPLVAVDWAKAHGEASNGAHCIILLEHKADRDRWRYLDPNPAVPDDPLWLPGGQLLQVWCGGFATIREPT